jgi:hypothetical protein
MSEQVTIYGEANNLPTIKQQEGFQMLLNKDPLAGSIATAHAAKGGGKYIPIGHIENQLDEIYSGLWQTSGKIEVMMNSIVATVTLKVFHPVAKVWIPRVGVGAVRLQLNANSPAMDASNMKGDAFEKGVGVAKSVALRNAAASLGVVFGRNLNRKDLDTFEFDYLSEQVDGLQPRAIEALELLESSKLPNKDVIRNKINKATFKSLEVIIKYLKANQP